MHIYSLEIFVPKLDLGKEIKKYSSMKLNIKCQKFIDTSFIIPACTTINNLKNQKGSGKALFFTCTIETLISAFNSDIELSVSEEKSAVKIGSTIMKWKKFEELAKRLNGNHDFVEDESMNNIMLNGAVTGSIKIQMCLIDFGDQIEVPISCIGSELTIPLTKRRSTYRYTGAQMNLKDDIVSTATVELNRPASTSLFAVARQHHASAMDNSSNVYADMRGMPTISPLQGLLTPEYIKAQLCGHKACKAALKFKKFGLGPFATDSYLGTISPEDTKDNVKKVAVKEKDDSIIDLIIQRMHRTPKVCCDTLDCPHGIIPELPKQDTPEQSDTEDEDFRPKKCKCLNCGNPAKPVILLHTCGTPNCPVTQEDVPCPYDKKKKGNTSTSHPRLSAGADTCLSSISEESDTWISSSSYKRQNAGADRYSSTYPCNSSTMSTPSTSQRANPSCTYYSSQLSTLTPQTQSTIRPKFNPNCRGQTCPYSKKECHGNICPIKPEKCPSGVCPSEACEEDLICDGIDCPFQSEGGTGFCLSSCSYGQCIRGSKKSKKNEKMIGELNSFLDKTKKLTSGDKSRKCKDISCPNLKDGDVCEDPDCPLHGKSTSEDTGTCGGKICPLEQKSQPEKIKRISIDSKKEKRLSLLINEKDKALFVGRDEFLSRELLGSLSMAEDDDLFFLLSQLLAERKRTQSLNNYYNSELMVSEKMLSSGDVREKKKHKGPCEKDTCKSKKYKTCKECGGISKSGATCDNTDVSFHTISLDSGTSTPGGDQNPPPVEKAPPPEEKVVPIIKKQSDTKPKPKEKEKMTVKITKPKIKVARFVYKGGEVYPGNRVGHKSCPMFNKNVPAQMGWLWNIKNDGERKRRKGWKPGTIRKDIEERIIANRRAKGIPDPPELKMLVRKKAKNFYESDSEEEEVIPKPTLIIQKKDGDYLITMNPLKDPKKLVDREDPYMRCKPIQFTITKPKKPEKPSPIIHHDEEMEGEYEGEEEYDMYNNNDCLCDEPNMDNQSSSSSDSELNIEFTTPAGIIIPERFKRPPNVVNADTQFKEAHFHCNDCPIVIPKKFKKDRRSRKK